MKVYAFIKIKENKHPQGSTTGDIIFIYPIDVPQARLDINDFFPVVIDLNIPCGENFKQIALQNRNAIPCSRCEYNDVDMCDVRKYTQAIWTEGTLENPPKVEKKRRYYIDRTQFIDPTAEFLAVNDEKTEEEKIQTFNIAKSNEQLKTIIADKMEIIKTGGSDY